MIYIYIYTYIICTSFLHCMFCILLRAYLTHQHTYIYSYTSHTQVYLYRLTHFIHHIVFFLGSLVVFVCHNRLWLAWCGLSGLPGLGVEVRGEEVHLPTWEDGAPMTDGYVVSITIVIRSFPQGIGLCRTLRLFHTWGLISKNPRIQASWEPISLETDSFVATGHLEAMTLHIP